MSWIKTDWDFGCPSAYLTLDLRTVAVSSNSGDDVMLALRQAMAEGDPSLVERVAMDLIVRHRPELRGCTLIAIDNNFRYMRWRFFVVHPSLPRKANEEMSDEISLIPHEDETQSCDDPIMRDGCGR